MSEHDYLFNIAPVSERDLLASKLKMYTHFDVGRMCTHKDLSELQIVMERLLDLGNYGIPSLQKSVSIRCGPIKEGSKTHMGSKDWPMSDTSDTNLKLK